MTEQNFTQSISTKGTRVPFNKMPCFLNDGIYYPLVRGHYGDLKYYCSKRGIYSAFCKTLGLLLFKIRSDKGIKPQDIYEQLGIGISTLDKLESGAHHMDWDSTTRLLAYYNLALTINFEQRIKEKEAKVAEDTIVTAPA